ncbi:O-antigen ligase domain-containing protein [Pseudanabaena mucicola]|uniref:O-antigen ligase domain-containing protein n=1 Tax=Pseudanabaena mucicola FACHB-723 TaxID=2692860 RepID=A0ABR7ZZT3_9CYAN|nr:O-antigen ligase domain-containing protein [Pseudanabaena mucicola]MBD2189099.1 O-antigen ligase domain-containing protein [Pseudanabaena mucicola FACHB-723]
MNSREDIQQLLASNKRFQPSQITEAWFVIVIFSFVTLVLLSTGGVGAKGLTVIFPLGSFVVSWFLYFRHPIFYIGFVWWLFFLASFVRRVADLNAGSFTDPSPILLSPFLANIVCMHTLYFNLPKVRENGTLPFILSLASIFYGYLIGIIQGDFLAASVRLLEWICPLLFGYHLCANWHRYPDYRRNFMQVFLWGALVMGVYGVYQFLVAPEWDRFWLTSSGMTSSSGIPEPLGIRVWSTLNSPGPFGDFMATALIILLSCRSVLVLPSAVFGTLSFLLSIVRTAWIGWFLGVIYLFKTLPTKLKFGMIATIIVLSIIIVPLSTIQPLSTTIGTRLETLSNLSQDNSARERQVAFTILFDDAISSVVGRGIGGFDTDSAFLVLMIELGWIGSVPYVMGMGGCIFSIFSFKPRNDDIFLPVVHAIVIKSLFFLLAGPTMRGSQGMLLWGFIGLALSGKKYYQITENNLKNLTDNI